jgi:TRAP-type mannitol/chloroaromatic compound transport system permease small subunit
MLDFYNLVSRKYAVFQNVTHNATAESYFYLFVMSFIVLCAYKTKAISYAQHDHTLHSAAIS